MARIFILSDDGTLPVEITDDFQCAKDKLFKDGRCPNKFLRDSRKKTFAQSGCGYNTDGNRNTISLNR
ncbi:hypothetical protein ACFL3G_12990 [Planctomycetota bacterium]